MGILTKVNLFDLFDRIAIENAVMANMPKKELQIKC